MTWLLISNLILLVASYEVLRFSDKALASRVRLTDLEWFTTRSSQLYIGWLLAGNFYKDLDNYKLKIFFEVCRLILSFSIIYAVYALMS